MTRTLFGLPVRDIPHRDVLLKYFLEHVEHNPTGCWVWKGRRYSNDYGIVSLGEGDKRQSAHRASYELFNGDIPEGLFVCHHCDNPPCIRPDHLFVGTASENMQDAVAKGRMDYSEARNRKVSEKKRDWWSEPQNKERMTGENNPHFGKLHTITAKKIIGEKSVRRGKSERDHAKNKGKGIRCEVSIDVAHAILRDTRRQIDIAADYGVSQSYISLIKLRKTWHFRED